MNKEKYVFAQLIEFLVNNKLRQLEDKNEGNRYVNNFTCWNQLATPGAKQSQGQNPLIHAIKIKQS